MANRPSRYWAYAAVLLVWFYAAVFSCLPLLGIGKYVPEGYLTTCSFDYLSQDTSTRLFVIIFFFAAWLVPFTIVVGCYTAIFLYVRKERKKLLAGVRDSHHQYYIDQHQGTTNGMCPFICRQIACANKRPNC